MNQQMLLGFTVLCALLIVNTAAKATQSKLCPTGAPIHGHNCRFQKCPKYSYHYCESAPTDAYSVCCPSLCAEGLPLMLKGAQVFCGRGPTRQDCPENYHCHISPVDDAFAVCCMN